MNAPSTHRIDVINLPDPRQNFEAYRAAQSKAKGLGLTLEEMIRRELEQRGIEVLSFVTWDYGTRAAVEVRRPA